MNEEIIYTDWLKPNRSVSPDGMYCHQLLIEQSGFRSEILDQLICFFEEAHEDARRHIRQIAGISLDPLGQYPSQDPADGYPALLHIITLQGYFGEILAGLICEYFTPHDESGWKVPAYLFRFHMVAFEQLEKRWQTGEDVPIIPGRTGNDCLAFILNKEGLIERTLFCEAKCTKNHRTNLIDEAHTQLSDSTFKPVSLSEVIEVLMDYEDPEASEWVEALRQLNLLDIPPDGYERCDLVNYICSQKPIRRATWIPVDIPNPNYTGGRRLEVVEIHINDVEDLIKIVYGKEDHAIS